MDLNKIIQDILDGNISGIRSSLVAKCGGIISNRAALNILTAISHLVRKNDTAIPDLYDLIILCCKNLTDMNNDETGKYLICLYHITRYFCKQKNFDNTLTLVEYVKRHCVAKDFKNDMYGYYILLFNNEVLQSPANFSADILQNVVLVTLNMQTLLVRDNDMNVFFNRFRSYCPLFKYPHITHAQRKTFCVELLKLLETVNMPDDKMICDEAYKALLGVVNLIIYSISDSKANVFPSFINDCLEQTFSVMRKLCTAKEYTDCTEILEGLSKTVFIDLKQRKQEDTALLNECSKKLEALLKTYGLTLSVANTYSEISKAFRILANYFLTCEDAWAEYLQPKLQVEFMRICEILGMVIAKNVLDKCCNTCDLKTDMFQAAAVTSFATSFSEVSSRLNLQCSDEFHQVTLRCFKTCCEYLNAMKQAGCEKYLDIWQVVGPPTFNTALALYENKYFNHCKLYCNLLYKNALSLEGMNSDGLCFKNCLSKSLDLYAECFSSVKQNREAMTYLSLVILLYPANRNRALESWILIKSNLADDDELKPKTVNNILSEQQEIIEQLLPNLTYEKHDLEEILMCELQNYVDNWPAKVAMSRVCNEICLVSNCVKNITKAFMLSWEKVVHVADNDILVNLEKTIDTVKDSDDLEDKLCLACLHFVLYKSNMYALRYKNVANMPLKSTPLPNPNDKCDIVPAYYNIIIDNVLPLFEILDKCLHLCDTVINSDLVKNVFDLMSEFKFGEIIKQIAYEYRLQHFHYNMLRAWNLYMKYGQLFDDKITILTSIGFILEYSDCSSNSSKKLELEAETLIPELFDSPEYLESIITYYINKSAGYLRSNLIKEGYLTLVIAEKYKADAAIEMELDVIEARLLHLNSLYILIPCEEKIMTHSENCLNLAENAYTTIAGYYLNKDRICSYILSLVLDLSLDSGYLCKWLRLPREARGITKSCVLVAQKLVLPIRTAQFLSLLSFVDLLDQQFDDCKVKLSGLTKILSYDKMWKPSLELDENVEKTENVKSLPEFMEDTHTCTLLCYKCRNFEYQRLVLDSIHLQSILNSYQGISRQAQNYFKGGLMLYEQLRKKSKSFSPVEVKLGNNETVTCVLNNQLLYTSCAFLLDYSYHLTRNWDLHKAQEVIDNILMLLDNRYQTNMFLWNEIWVQRLNLMDDAKEEETDTELQSFIDSVTSKTPEHKISQSKTPAPSVPKYKVYSPKTVKSKRCKTLIAPNRPSANKVMETCKSETKAASYKLVDKRMKLLTEKLKAETKSLRKKRNSIDILKESDNSGNKTGICKKNLDELEEVTDAIEGLVLENKTTKTINRTKAKANSGTKTKKTSSSTEVVTKKRTRIIAPVSSSDSCSEETGLRRSTRNRAPGKTSTPSVPKYKVYSPKIVKSNRCKTLKKLNTIDILKESDNSGNKTGICKKNLDELEEVTDAIEGLVLENKTTKTINRTKAKANSGTKTKKTSSSTQVVTKKRTRIIAPVSSSDSCSEEIGHRRSERNRAK